LSHASGLCVSSSCIACRTSRTPEMHLMPCVPWTVTKLRVAAFAARLLATPVGVPLRRVLVLANVVIAVAMVVIAVAMVVIAVAMVAIAVATAVIEAATAVVVAAHEVQTGGGVSVSPCVFASLFFTVF
jgi:hypothetical protein